MRNRMVQRLLFVLLWLGLWLTPSAAQQPDSFQESYPGVEKHQVIPVPTAPIRTPKLSPHTGLYLSGGTEFRLGMSLAELESALGPWPDFKKDWAVFSNGLTVMLRDDKVIHLSCTPTGTPLRPDLALGSNFTLWGIGLGDPQDSLKSKLGAPTRRLRRPDGALICWVYKRAGQPDLGYILGSNGRVEAMLMVERDKLEGILITRGYTVL